MSNVEYHDDQFRITFVHFQRGHILANKWTRHTLSYKLKILFLIVLRLENYKNYFGDSLTHRCNNFLALYSYIDQVSDVNLVNYQLHTDYWYDLLGKKYIKNHNLSTAASCTFRIRKYPFQKQPKPLFFLRSDKFWSTSRWKSLMIITLIWLCKGKKIICMLHGWRYKFLTHSLFYLSLLSKKPTIRNWYKSPQIYRRWPPYTTSANL